MADRAVAPRFPIVAWLERRSRRQWMLAGAVLVLVAVWRLLRFGAGLLLERWWLHATTSAPVWRVTRTAQLELAAGAFVVTTLVLGGSVWLVLRTGRQTLAPQHRVFRWYHDRMGPANGWLQIAIAAYVVWQITRTAPGLWQQWLLFLHGEDLGVHVPGVGGDLGTFLFSLPFRTSASLFVRQLLLFTLAMAVGGHLVSGALRLRRSTRSRRLAVAHVALLGAALVTAQVLHHVFVQRPSLALNRGGGFVGAGWTERNVVGPLTWVAAVVGLITVAAVARAVVVRRWRLVVVTASALAAVELVGVVLLPLAVERVVVAPARGERQLSAIGHHLDATRAAYGLDRIGTTELTVSDGAADAAGGSDDTVARTPLFDPSTMAAALQVLSGTQGTRITQVDLDRYTIDGTERPVMVAARQPDRGGLPERGWVQEHLVYTHGDGAVLVPADRVDIDGRPDLRAETADTAHDAATYFGEGLDGWWAVVATKRRQQDGAEYHGSAGVPVGSTWRRLVTATALGDPQLLLSAELTSQSELLYRRGLRDRLTALAPFLSWDSDPYAAVVDGRLVWIVDGYTTSATYPYAQYFGSDGLPAGSDLATTQLNYLRLAARATVDATDGATHLYRDVAAGDDPVLELWDDLLPGLFEDEASMPASLMQHLRYPKDLFVVQSALLGRYHVTDAETLFNGSDTWAVSPAPAATVGDTNNGPAAPVFSFGSFVDGSSSWSLTRTFNRGGAVSTGSARDELAAVVVADNDRPGSLTLVTLRSADGRQLSGPRVAQSALTADPDLARTISLLDANGSKVQFGPMTPHVVDGGVVWVRSLLVSGAGTSSVPRLQSVVAVSGGEVGVGDDAPSAVRAAATR